MRAFPRFNFGYGAGFAVFGWIIVAAAVWFRAYYLVLPFTAGFFLLAPILAVGLYEISRRVETGATVDWTSILTAWRRNQGQIALMGFLLLAIHLIWIRIATLLFAIFFSKTPPDLSNFVIEIVMSSSNIPFLLLGSVIGLLLATLVFSIAVVSIPMLLDRNVGLLTAVATSFKAVSENKWPMLVWAVLIVLFIAAGILTGFIGLIVTLPLVAHASWHAYRQVVVPASET
ncbi:MAG: DUF2189 domain-containing protein [Alphaproteobacteria bacterium]